MKVGDTVTLKNTSEFFDPTGEDEFNPFGVEGIVTDVQEYHDERLFIIVDWQSVAGPYNEQCTNSYNPVDLDLI